MQWNNFLVHKFSEDSYLLSSEPGNWLLVSGKEYELIRKNQVYADRKLLKKLIEKKLIVTNSNKEELIEDYRNKYSHLYNGVTLHIVNPTNRCNLSCSYCYAQAKPLKAKNQDMSLETAKKVLDFIYQSPSKSLSIEFQGGECLLNLPVIEFMVNEAKKRKGKKIHFRLVSNLTLMDNTIARFLVKNKINDICSSLDGPKEVHNKNRANYNETVYWIKELKNEYDFERIPLLCTVTKHSLPYAKEIVKEYLDLGIQDFIPVNVRPVGNALNDWKKIAPNAEDYLKFWKQTVEECINWTRKGKFIQEHTTGLILKKILSPCNPNHTCFSKPCGAGLMQASYQVNGDIYCCDEGKAFDLFKLGNAFESNYSQVFASPQALNLVSLSSALAFDCNNCIWSPYCRFCPVITYGSQRNMVPKLALDEECKIKKEQIKHVFEKYLFSKDKKILLKWLSKAKF